MMYWDGNLSWWAVIAMWIGMIAFWGLIIWAVYFFVTGATRPPHSARRILDARLARGEIDLDEYRRLRDAMADRDATVGANSGGPP